MDKSFNTLMTDFLGKIDLGLLFKVAIELMLFVIVLNVINKLINKVCKIILRMKDLETKSNITPCVWFQCLLPILF